MREIILQGTTKAELIQDIKSELLSGFRDLLQDQHRQNTHRKEWLTVREVSDLLKISTVTVHQWSKTGRLKKHRIGSRVRFRKDEVLTSVKEVESKK